MLHPLESQGIFQLALSEQCPGSGWMLLDDAVEQHLGLLAGGRRVFTVADRLVGHEPPGVGFGVRELVGIFFHPSAGPVVFVATDLHGQEPASDQVEVRLPSP